MITEIPVFNAGLSILLEDLWRGCIVFIDEEEVEFAEIKPFLTRNIWVGKFTRLYTAEAAANINHAGSTALICATVNNKVPEMVARTSNGYFYPATKNDIAIPLTD